MDKLGRRFGRGRGVASVDGEVACEASAQLHHPGRVGAALMARIALLGDIHGNAAALDAVRKAIKAAKPDAVMVAGDLVLNGPEPAAAVDADPRARGRRGARRPGQHRHRRRRLRLRGGLPVADRRRARVVPLGGRVGPRRARARPGRLAAAPAGRAPAAARRHARARLPRLAGLADGGLRPGPRPERDDRADVRGPTPGSSPAATPTCPRSATSAGRSSSTRAAPATSSTAIRPHPGR